MSVADEKLKPSQYTRLHANSIEPVVQAVRKMAARQVIKHGESGRLQDLINYVMLALTHEKYQTGEFKNDKGEPLTVDNLYREGKKQFAYAMEHKALDPKFVNKNPV